MLIDYQTKEQSNDMLGAQKLFFLFFLLASPGGSGYAEMLIEH